MRTSSPDFSESVITSKTPSTAFWASIFERPVRSANFWTRSFLFTGVLLMRGPFPQDSALYGGGFRRQNAISLKKNPPLAPPQGDLLPPPPFLLRCATLRLSLLSQ